MITIETKINKSGNKVALVRLNNGGYLVYIQKCNYSQGKDVYKWFPCLSHPKQEHNDFQLMVKTGMMRDQAIRLFKKRSK